MTKPDEEDSSTLTISEVERKHGIKESIRDYPWRYLGLPPSKYYVQEEPDYEASHRDADAAMAWLRKKLAGRRG